MTAPSPLPPAANFSRLASIYRSLEFLAFGGDLERVRFHHLDQLRSCSSILILGEGDGRFLARLVERAPAATIECIDASAAMLGAAAQRLPVTARPRVQFTCADLRSHDFGDRRFDAVVTLFFLDCFTTAEVAAIVQRVQARLLPGARWLLGDFVMPPRGWPRLRAGVWLAVLYTFFRWETGLRVRSLPDSDGVLARAGFRAESAREFQHGLLRTTLYRISSSETPAAGA